MKRSTPSSTPKSPRNPGGSTTSWTPRPTDVLAYVNLWHREAEAGREEGAKDRPVVVVVASEKRDQGTQLLVVPVTTRPPRAGDDVAVEMPPRVQEHLGLGDARCWIVVDEYNLFTWSGPDVRPTPQRGAVSPHYGFIPGKLFEQVRARIKALARSGRLKGTTRTE